MDIKDPLHFSHHQFLRGVQKNHEEGHDHPDQRDTEMDNRMKDLLNHTARVLAATGAASVSPLLGSSSALASRRTHKREESRMSSGLLFQHVLKQQEREDQENYAEPCQELDPTRVIAGRIPLQLPVRGLNRAHEYRHRNRKL